MKNPTIKKSLVVSSAAVLLAAPFVTTWEGREYTPYRDIGGVLTVCDGHTGSDIIEGKTYTDAECDALLAKDLTVAEKAVDRAIRTELPTATKAAFISFTYNVGAQNLRSSTLAKLANAGDLVGACNQLSRWTRVKGVVIRGLVNRRLSEKGMCLEGLGQNPWYGV